MEVDYESLIQSGEERRSSRTPLGASKLFIRLSLMMFLQYFVQGAYLPVVSVYVRDALGFSNQQIGIFGAALSVGPMLAPFLVGQFVDRYFATERVMAVCHLVGGLLMLLLCIQTDQSDPWVVIGIGALYSLLYVPTMMLSNLVAFRHLSNSDVQFPRVRLFGTIGFILPAYLVEFWWLQGLTGIELQNARAIVFALSGGAGIILGLYCVTLPHTPPQPDSDRSYAPASVMRMLRRRDFAVLVLVSFFIAIAHQFFFVWNSPFLRDLLDSGNVQGAYEQSISSVGQVFEIGVMAVLGLLISRCGFKWTMTIGAVAYTLRCVLLGLVFLIEPYAGKLALTILGQALHGLCFGCFMAVAYMYVDRIAPRDVKGSMQTLYGTLILALGFFVGALVSGWIGDLFSDTQGNVENWTGLWLSCAVLAGTCTAAFAALFPDCREDDKPLTDESGATSDAVASS